MHGTQEIRVDSGADAHAPFALARREWITNTQLGAWTFVIVLLLWCAGAIAIGARTRGIDPDSVSYLDAARSLADGHGYTHRWAYWDPIYSSGRLPTSSSLWPPGFSLAIAGGLVLGLDGVTLARALVFASFALVLVMLFAWGRRVGSPLAAAAAAAVSIAPSRDATLVATELPFFCAATAALLCCVKAIEVRSEGARVRWWAAASAAAGVAFLMRYVGLAAVGSVGLLAAAAWLAGRASWRACAVALIPGPAIVAVTFFRNWMASGRFGQPWPGADIFWATFPGSLKASASALLKADVLNGALAAFVLLKLVAVAVLILLATRALFAAIQTTPAELRLERFASTVALVVFGLSTGALTVVATALNGMNIEPRYLTVIAPWGLVLAAAWALTWSAAARGRRAVLPWVCCAVWVLTEAIVAIPAMRAPHANYVDAGVSSAGITWARANTTPAETLLTNRGADLAYWTPNRVARLPRLPHSAHRTVTLRDLDSLADRLGARYMIHFRGYPDEAKYDRAEFEFVRRFDDPAVFGDRAVAVFSDSIVYRVGSTHVGR